MKLQQLVAILMVPILFTGCASIVGQSVFPVTINSSPDGASILVKDEYGKEVYAGTTPSTVTLPAGESYFHAKTYYINFSRPGYADQVSVLKADIDGWYFGNILIGGLIGMLIIDPITGKMWKLPKDVYANLAQKTAMNRQRSLQILSLNDIPEAMRKNLVRVN